MFLSGNPLTNDPVVMAAQNAAWKRLHGAAASIADSKARFTATGDARYLQSVRDVLPLYQSAREAYAEAGAGTAELSGIDRFILDTGNWVAAAGKVVGRVAGQITDPVFGVARGIASTVQILPLLLAGAVVVLGIMASKGKLGLSGRFRR